MPGKIKLKLGDSINYDVGGTTVSSKMKILLLKKAIDAGQLTRMAAFIAISQGMENKVRGRMKAHKPITFEDITNELRNDEPFLEQMERLEIHIEDIEKVAGGFLKQETLDKIKATIDTKVKIGRNDPCPCGSGKKYKKCCGR